jgi:hypothetical protein
MRGTFKQILGSLLVCALLIAAAIPAGFMPNIARAAAPDGTLYPLVLCTAYGEKTVYVPAAQTPDAPAQTETPAQNNTAHHDLCPYAPVLAQGLPAPAAVLTPALYSAVRAGVPGDAAAVKSAPFKTWQAQAPPLF